MSARTITTVARRVAREINAHAHVSERFPIFFDGLGHWVEVSQPEESGEVVPLGGVVWRFWAGAGVRVTAGEVQEVLDAPRAS